MPTISNDIIAHILGNQITFMDCFVLNTPIIIAQLGTKFIFQEPASSISLPPGSDPKVMWSACVPTAAVLATDFGVFYTTDGFQTTVEIRISDDILNIPMRDQISDLAIVARDTLILIQSTLYRVTDYDVFIVEKVPDRGIIGIQARTWCVSGYPIGVSILKCLFYVLFQGKH